ncbi:Hypothetical predicted protein [Xyrichtys novacula]|uniref:Uncharacterized protein n=1 Tax=Xyrichtys novacula TaxID=13765 RepID=A0AAV1F5H1_XYRNO|nr:Hypothetical predicted protein [Xyrichtys novacula]
MIPKLSGTLPEETETVDLLKEEEEEEEEEEREDFSLTSILLCHLTESEVKDLRDVRKTPSESRKPDLNVVPSTEEEEEGADLLRTPAAPETPNKENTEDLRPPVSRVMMCFWF